jgi:hypothetical protein
VRIGRAGHRGWYQYEGSGDLHGELIVQLAAALDVSADEILGLKASGRSNGAIRNRQLSGAKELKGATVPLERS